MTGSPDGEALARVAQVWASGLTGSFRSDHVPGRSVVIRGEPRDDQSRAWLEAAIRAGALSFSPATDFGRGPTSGLADLLWGLACELARPAMLERAGHALLVDGLAARCMPRLPLSAPCERLVQSRADPHEDLRTLLTRLDIQGPDIAFELAALVAMGALHLRIPPGAQPYPQPTLPRSAPKPGPRPAPKTQRRPARQRPPVEPRLRKRKAVDYERIHRRLEREWGIMEKADDYTVVGVSRQMPAEVVQRACDRMLGRYSKLARDERLPEEAHALAARIHERVSDAVVRLRQGRGTSFQAARPGSADPYTAGMGFVEQGDWTRAVKCFNMARHQDPHSGRNVAWLGWAVFNDPTLPTLKRRKKARELLDLAETLDVSDPSTGKLLARLDYAEGDLVRAWNRLDALVTRDPDDRDARELLVRVQKDIKQRK